MSYTIDFIKTKNLNIDNIYDILEAEELSPEDDIFISTDLMKSIIADLSNENLTFKTFEGPNQDYFELNFPTYQVSFYNSEVAISVPYWNENQADKINHEIKVISNILLKNGFTGFDSQTEEFITEPYELQTSFVESNQAVQSILTENTEPACKGKPNTSESISVPLVILAVVILGFIFWRLLK